MPRIDILLEAERRGILPDDKKQLLAEARKRGLVKGTVNPEYLAQAAKNEAYLQRQEDQQPQGSAVGRFFTGLGESLDPRPLLQAVASPVETAKGIGRAQMGQFEKAGEALSRGSYVEGLGQGAAGLLPIVGPAAAAVGEQIGSGDVAGGLGAGLAAVAPGGALKAARATGAPARLTASAQKQFAQALGPTKEVFKRKTERVVPQLLQERVRGGREHIRSVARERAERAGERLTEAENRIKDQVVKEVTEVEEPLPPPSLREAMQRHQEGITEAWRPGGRLDQQAQAQMFPFLPTRVVKDAPKPARPTTRTRTVVTEKTVPSTIKTKPIIESLQRAKQRFTTGRGKDKVIGNEAAYKNLDKLQKQIAGFGDDVSYQTIRKLRQIWDREVAEGGGFFGGTLKEKTALNAKKEATNAIRRELAKEHPDIAKINAEYSLWRTTEEILDATIERTRGQARPLSQTIAQAAGAGGGLAAGGGIGTAVTAAAIGGAAFKGLTRIFQSPTWRTVSATKKQQVAEAIASGRMDKIGKILTGYPVLTRGLEQAQSAPPPQQVNRQPDSLAAILAATGAQY